MAGKTLPESPTPPAALDVVSFGESMLRLSPPVGYSLENAPRFDLFVGGTESNMSIAFARMGGRAGWVSRLPDNGIGRRIAHEIGVHGVDVSRVIWAVDGRAGLIFIDTAPPPRGNDILYDRARSAIAELRPDELDWDYLASAKILFLTGITPALSAGCREAWLRAAKEAKAKGRRVAVDVNYRAKLWTPEQARETLEAVLPHCDALISAHRDLRTIFDMPEDAEVAAREFAKRYRVPMVVLTLGEQGALCFENAGFENAGFDGEMRRAPAFPCEPLDRIGSGDAFVAGFLKGWLEGDLDLALRLGNASAALKQTFRGDHSWATLREVMELVESGAADKRHVRR
jgi:2-dehydro-3-deoxygluconokinase